MSGDEAWLLARERGEPVSASTEAQAAYRRLEAAIAELPERPAPAGFEDRILAALDAPISIRPRRLRRALLIAAPLLAAAAAIALLVITRPGPDSAPGLSVGVRQGRMIQRSASAALGDVLVVTARGGAALRIYRDSALVARCPGDPACRDQRGAIVLELPLTVPGRYRAVMNRDGGAVETSMVVEVR